MAMHGAESAESQGSGVEAREYLRVLGRRRWTVATTVILCTALALAYVLLAPKSYSAAATVLVKPVVADWTASTTPNDKSLDIATEQAVAASDAVATDVRTKLHLATAPADLLGQLMVTPGTGTATTLTFSYADRNPTTARNVALAFATGYLARRQNAAKASLSTAQRILGTQIAALEQQLAKLEAARSDPTAPQTPSETIAANQISSLRTTLTRLSLATVDAGSVISEPPSADQLDSTPKAGLLLPAGILLGLVLGLILAFVRDRMSNRMFLSPTSTALLRPAVLATIPLKPRAIRRQARAGTLAATDAGSPAAAAFGRAAEHVRAQLTTANASVVVTSAHDGEAASVVAANLAAALAGTGTSVTLLSRLAPAALADLAGTPATFTDALTGRAALADLGAPVAGCPTLRVVPFGELAPGALRTNAALDLVRLLQESRHVLVVDAPPLLTGADGLALAATADLVLLTVVDRVTRRSALAAAAEHVAAVGTPLLRVVVLTAGRVSGSARPSGRAGVPAGRPRVPAAVTGNGQVRTEVAEQQPSEVR